MGLNAILISTIVLLGISLYINLFLIFKRKNKTQPAKFSEILREEAGYEDNDIKSFALMCKALREERSEKFVDGWLVPLMGKYVVEHRKNGSYTITTEAFGKIDYYPKANKLLIRKLNSWKKPGLKWIVVNLLHINYDN